MQPREPFDHPRERLRRHGVDALTTEELVALVLQTGQGQQSALEIAAGLLRDRGTISVLAEARPEELTLLSGIGPAKAGALVASFRLARIAAGDPSPTTLQSAADVAAVAMGELGSARRERVIVLVCDGTNRLRRAVSVSEGSIDRALFPVREILNAVLRHDGRAFAVAHNHPSGDPTPGPADVRATEEIRAAAGTVGLRFLGHLVVAGNAWQSVRERRETPR